MNVVINVFSSDINSGEFGSLNVGGYGVASMCTMSRAVSSHSMATDIGSGATYNSSNRLVYRSYGLQIEAETVHALIV